jgi:peroxiredoxin
MSLTPSTMMELGTKAPDFSLPEVRTGDTVTLSDFKEKEALLVVFMCAHCPYVKLVENELASIGREFQNRSFGMVAISANDAESYPEDAPPKLKAQAEKLDFVFPYLYDQSQDVAKAYRAACTPDIFLFNSERDLVYRGQLDDARPGNDKPVSGKNLRVAIEALYEGKPIPELQIPATGCNIKWKPGNEPKYFG